MIENEILLGLRIKKIGESLYSQTSSLLANQDYKYEPRSLSVLIALADNEQSSVKDIANLLGMTHPAIVQMINYLIKVELIRQKKSPKDKRASMLELTEKGKGTIDQLKPVLSEIKNEIKRMIDSIDENLIYSLSKLDKTVKGNHLKNNVECALKEKAMNDIVIIPFKKRFKKDFERLNVEWLEKYFEVEKEDERLLKHPEKEIITKGGEVFFALDNDEAVGTCAVLKISDSTYELTKMAVTEKAQGKQIGKKLALTTVGFAVEKGAEKLRLSTSVKLRAALGLYKTLGFKEIKSKVDERYKRELIHMELDLGV